MNFISALAGSDLLLFGAIVVLIIVGAILWSRRRESIVLVSVGNRPRVSGPSLFAFPYIWAT
ncbi:MAG: hypothetical protein Q7R62_02265, partial [bacterium]|nr:hypothetical protein [bacterium]